MPLKPYRNLAHFNSQPHEEADDGQQTAEPDNHISTHSLTKRLTPGTAWGFVENWHFNSQPHEEADNTTTLNTHKPLYFNSQPHEEADDLEWSNQLKLGISTHSLTKRLTSGEHYAVATFTFQLTASRRGWRNLEFWSEHCKGHFNSQPHEEADVAIGLMANSGIISTHSLTKRLTEHSSDHPWRTWSFQLTASRRGWQHADIETKRSIIFQLTASRRGWPGQHTSAANTEHFNSQPHEEADEQVTAEHKVNVNFNSQPHEEADGQ